MRPKQPRRMRRCSRRGDGPSAAALPGHCLAGIGRRAFDALMDSGLPDRVIATSVASFGRLPTTTRRRIAAAPTTGDHAPELSLGTAKD
ncbi:hypothetical protein IscW_ISCW002034 [Ixodes scapularis]|uniref:Uncharacterized protein n=1 Tax=Ixodes scapularis TaxID=6945 RepID=B7P8J8_IXOSC|nr:hypothetical protein IscW_ISCW002034 [Ixodes scapularis]|eukprot:XP_002402200.1 hypothetical protein IscW_ISCW002034 [Ixodes scapularis]